MRIARKTSRSTTAPGLRRAAGLAAAVLLAGGAALAAATPTQAADQASEDVTAAAHLDTRLEVINETQGTVQVQLCDHGGWNVGSKCNDYTVQREGSAVVTSYGTTSARATFSFPSSPENITFDAYNPTFGVPAFAFDTGSRHTIGLVAGEVHYVNAREHVYRLERRGDSADYKEMRLIVTS